MQFGTPIANIGLKVMELMLSRIESETPPEQSTDHRAHGRYPISLALQYKLLRAGRVQQSGAGRTLNISSGGVLFETDDPLPERGLVEVAMKWPFLLHGTCGMKLIMRGRIVRSRANGRGTAIRAQFKEFRTAGMRKIEEEEPKVLRAGVTGR